MEPQTDPDPTVALLPAHRDPERRQARPSLTRAASNRRVRLVQEAKRGNVNALRSGIHAEVANLDYVSDELATIYATHPHLEPLADRRLVELLAIATIQHRRAVLAIEREGPDANLTKWEANLGARVERHLQRIHERNIERARATERAATLDLRAYRVNG